MAQRVFIVAGSNDILQNVASLLDSNLDIVLLQSSNEALWELQQIAPDVLIADNDLPGFSGLDLADLVPNFSPDTRVVLVSRKSDPQLISDGQSSGVFRVLDQNPTGDDIALAIKDALAAEPVERVEPVSPPPAPDPVVETKPEPAPAQRPSQPATRMAGPPLVSKPPQAGLSKGPPPVSSRPVSTPPRAKMGSAPPVSARPEPVTRASAPPVSARPTTQRTPTTPREQPPAQTPPATPAPSDETGGLKLKKQGGSLVLTAATVAPLGAKLKDLGLQLGAQATILTDRWGVPLVEDGRTSLPLPPFLPLLATSFSTMIDYTRQLHNDHGSGLYMHEGDRYDIYIFDVGRQFLLVMIFDKAIAASKLGSVWLYAKRAVRELAEELEG